MTGLGRKKRYSETGPQNEKEQQLLLLSPTLSPPTVESRRPRSVSGADLLRSPSTAVAGQALERTGNEDCGGRCINTYLSTIDNLA